MLISKTKVVPDRLSSALKKPSRTRETHADTVGPTAPGVQQPIRDHVTRGRRTPVPQPPPSSSVPAKKSCDLPQSQFPKM